MTMNEIASRADVLDLATVQAIDILVQANEFAPSPLTVLTYVNYVLGVTLKEEVVQADTWESQFVTNNARYVLSQRIPTTA